MAGKQTASSIHWVYPPPEGTTLFPELHYMGCQKYAKAYFLTVHRHERAYEFVYLEQGSVTWEVEGVHYPTHAGQWFFTRPGELHRARFDHMEPSKIWWFIVTDPGVDPDWFRLDAPEREFVLDRLGRLPRVFHAGGTVRGQLARLKTLLEADVPGRRLFARHHTLDILLGMLQTVPYKEIEPALGETMIRLVDRMTRTLEQRVSVAQMAREVRVSTPHFYKLFHELFGLAPSTYMERIRMERACALLKTNRSVTEIAFDLGYKTSQHFSTVFKKLVGMAPNDWRKENNSGEPQGGIIKPEANLKISLNVSEPGADGTRM